MSVTISINIQLDATDPAAFDAQLAAIARNLLGRAAQLSTTVALPSAPPRTMPPTPGALSGRPPKRSAASAPAAPDGPETHRTLVLAPDAPAAPAMPQIVPIPPATKEKDEGEPTPVEPKAAKQRNTRPRESLPFAEFDTLVAKELRRLSVDGRIPNAGLWDAQRDQRLPTYVAVMYRYGCTNLASFAEKMGMHPPLSKAFTINQNGANAIYDKEAGS